MVYKSIILAGVIALASFATATPPACLLAAINQAPMIADFASICGDNASDMQSTIQSVCHSSNVEAAQRGFIDACKTKGHEVAEATTSDNEDDSASPSGADSSQSASPTGLTTSTRGSQAGASPTGSASGTPSSNTNGAGQLTIGAGVAGVAGAAVAVLFAML